MSKIKMRFIDVGDARYVHVDDAAAFLRELGGSEETDVRIRLEAGATNLLRVARPTRKRGTP